MINLFENNDSCPPLGYLLEISLHCPKALHTYLYLWKHKDPQDVVRFSNDKSTIEEMFMKSKTRFINDLTALSLEGIITVMDDREFYEIEMLNWDNMLMQSNTTNMFSFH